MKGARRLSAEWIKTYIMAFYDVLGWVVSFTVGDSVWETIARLFGLLAVVFLVVLFLVKACMISKLTPTFTVKFAL